ncbi:MAG: SCO family protein [FCB group bacterium]|jgi:protein SCO1/2|nr:SCO family protein [FCB group bacterium]
MKAKYLLAGSGVALGLAGILMILALRLPALSQARPMPDVYYDVPPFTFTDSNGQTFTRDHLKSKVWVIDFIFTTCPGPCPILSGQMSRLHQTFRGDERVHFVSVSVDPEHDTPEVMKAYAENLGANTSLWHFLTGPHADVDALTAGLKLGSGGQPAMHDTHFVLVDGRGRVRGYYQGTDRADVDELAADLRLLLKEEEGE